MSLSLVVAILLPLSMAPWHTHRTFEAVYRRERVAVAVDNGAIRLGKRLRGALETWRRIERQARAMETVHHLAHLCARTPTPSAATCLEQDQAMERALGFLFMRGSLEAQAQWTRASLDARAEGPPLGSEVRVTGLGPRPWVEREACPVCGGSYVLRWGPPLPIRLVGRAEDGPDETLQVELYREREGWQYRWRGGEDCEESGIDSL